MFIEIKKSEIEPGAQESAPATQIKFRDRRLFLKLKLKSLAAESRIIRAEERRPNASRALLYPELRLHRTGTVRSEARHTLLAYGFLRGRSYRQIEAKAGSAPNWTRVEAMVKRYGEVFGGNWQ